MKDKITEILYNHFGWQRKVSIEKATDEILALPLYPKEFMEWLILEQEIFFGELTEGYILNDNPYKDGVKLKALDEFYEYWKSLPK